jgi:hypothetical protein
MFEIHRNYGTEATEGYKLALLEYQTSTKQNIFHALASCLKNRDLSIQVEVLQLFTTLQVDPFWFGPPINQTSAQQLDFKTLSLALPKSSSSIYPRIQSALKNALTQRDITGKSPADLISDPVLKALWKPIIVQPVPGIVPKSFIWSGSKEQALDAEVMMQLRRELS